MNTQEAKFILQAYRPGGQDANDPQFAEALAQAKQDPILAQWFADQVAFDAVVSRKLRAVAVPQNLKASILAGQRVIQPAAWWQRPAWLAMAAAFVLCLGLAGLWFNREQSLRFTAYSEKMILATVDNEKHLDLKGSDPKQIQAWFAGHQAETNLVLPAALSSAPSMGCRVLDWHGKKVSMLCYVLNGKHMDLFVIKRQDFPDAPPQNQPQFVRSGQATTVSWSHDDEAYLLIGEEDVSFFKKLMGVSETGRAGAGQKYAMLPVAVRQLDNQPIGANLIKTIYLE